MIEKINHDRSFPSDGPTCMINGVDAVVVVVAGTAAGVSVAPPPQPSSSPAATTNCSDSTSLLQQPFFDIASSSPFTPISLKSPGAEVAGRMAAASTLGFFPFTNAQWKELEIQATIYKYMMASVPVPPDLLLPITRNHLSHLPYPSSHSTLGRGSVFRFSNNGDPEPGRCRRTDGKKWRCARDVATPEQKYCERHMNRGRPRSRKPVELHSDSNNKNKKPRHVLHSNPPPPLVFDPPINVSNNGGYGTGSISQTPYFVNHPLFNKASSGFESAVSVSTYKEPRTMGWMMKEETVPTSDQQWQHLMQQPKICSIFNQNYANFGAIQDQNNGGSSSFLNLDEMGSFEKPQTETPSRCFIDAWSNRTETEYKNGSSNNNNKDSVSSSLTLSMASTINDDEMGHLQMGLGLIESDNDHKKTQMSNWLNTPGGPLAEVLRLPALSAATNPESPTTMSLSTSSGVLQRTTNGSNIVSDSSGNSSPTTTVVKQPETAGFMWLNQSKLAAAASTSSDYERF